MTCSKPCRCRPRTTWESNEGKTPESLVAATALRGIGYWDLAIPRSLRHPRRGCVQLIAATPHAARFRLTTTSVATPLPIAASVISNLPPRRRRGRRSLARVRRGSYAVNPSACRWSPRALRAALLIASFTSRAARSSAPIWNAFQSPTKSRRHQRFCAICNRLVRTTFLCDTILLLAPRIARRELPAYWS